MLGPFLPLYFQHLGFDSIQIGMLMSVGPLISLVANPFWGYWSDRLQNTRLIINIMLIGNIAASQIYFQSDRFLFVFLLMLVFYFFQTALSSMTSSLTLHLIENTSYQFGTFRLWGSLGFAVMVILSSPVITWIGIQNLGYLYGSFVLITLLFSFGLPAQGKRKKGSAFPVKEFSKLMRSGLFLSFLLLSVLVSISNQMNSNFISLFIGSLGGSEVYVGWSWFIAAILEVPLFLMLDRYLKVTEKAMFGVLTVVGALYTVRWTLMALAGSPLQIVLIQLLHAFTFGVMFYTGTQICDFLVPKAVRSSGQALYGLCSVGISGVVGGLFGGWLFDHLGAERMYWLCAVLSAAGMLGFLGIWNHFRRKGQEQAGRGTEKGISLG
jgi:PPP family 3-phenylpropionic acid transporter